MMLNKDIASITLTKSDKNAGNKAAALSPLRRKVCETKTFIKTKRSERAGTAKRNIFWVSASPAVKRRGTFSGRALKDKARAAREIELAAKADKKLTKITGALCNLPSSLEEEFLVLRFIFYLGRPDFGCWPKF